MNIWLIHVGELLPMDGAVRPFRYGILAEALAARGHDVTRWAPTFAHALKKQRADTDAVEEVAPGYEVRLLRVPPYRTNVSVRRLISHGVFARRMADEMERMASPPDVILAAIPTPSAARAAVTYGQRHAVPVVVDIRDLWPDIYLTGFPSPVRPVAEVLLAPFHRVNRSLLRDASGIIAVSRGYLEWGLRYVGRSARERDRVFPLGYPDPFAKAVPPEARAELTAKGVDWTKQICVFFGSFEASYDLETVVSAARLLHEGGHGEVQFVLCGTGSALPDLRAQAGDLPNVIFPGWVGNEEVRALLQAATFGLAAYRGNALQGLPNKLLEYMAGELALVSSLAGEATGLIAGADCGVSYPAGSPQALADVLVSLKADPPRLQDMCRRARRTFERDFDAGRVYGRLVDYLEHIAGGGE